MNAHNASGFVMITAKRAITSPINIPFEKTVDTQKRWTGCMRQNYRQLIPLLIDCHGNTMKSLTIFTEQMKEWRFYFSWVTRQERVGVILNHFDSTGDDSYC